MLAIAKEQLDHKELNINPKDINSDIDKEIALV